MSPERAYGVAIAGVLLCAYPSLLLAAALRGSVGAITIVAPLLVWRAVSALTSGAFADRHTGLVWTLSILVYAGVFAAVAFIVHRLTRERSRRHHWSLVVTGLLYLWFVFFAFPVAGLPI
jgi:hypothetical protein